MLCMSRLILSRGEITFVDKKDFEKFGKYKWYLGSRGYVTRSIAKRDNLGKWPRRIFLHREILNSPKGYLSDHINGNKLDNRRINLRICTARQNCYNRKIASNNASGIKGVYYRPKYIHRKWAAYIKLPDKLKFIGGFLSKEAAAKAYKETAKDIFGEFTNYG